MHSLIAIFVSLNNVPDNSLFICFRNIRLNIFILFNYHNIVVITSFEYLQCFLGKDENNVSLQSVLSIVINFKLTLFEPNYTMYISSFLIYSVLPGVEPYNKNSELAYFFAIHPVKITKRKFYEIGRIQQNESRKHNDHRKGSHVKQKFPFRIQQVPWLR